VKRNQAERFMKLSKEEQLRQIEVVRRGYPWAQRLLVIVFLLLGALLGFPFGLPGIVIGLVAGYGIGKGYSYLVLLQLDITG